MIFGNHGQFGQFSVHSKSQPDELTKIVECARFSDSAKDGFDAVDANEHEH